jgi:hypothetical protein
LILQYFEIDISVAVAAVLEKIRTAPMPMQMMKLVEGIRRQQSQAMALKPVDENDHRKVTTLDEEDD